MQRFQAIVSITDQRYEVGEKCGIGSTPIEERHIMTTAQCLRHHVRSDETGSAKYQDAELLACWLCFALGGRNFRRKAGRQHCTAKCAGFE